MTTNSSDRSKETSTNTATSDKAKQDTAFAQEVKTLQQNVPTIDPERWNNAESRLNS